jgi:hypothetical protein
MGLARRIELPGGASHTDDKAPRVPRTPCVRLEPRRLTDDLPNEMQSCSNQNQHGAEKRCKSRTKHRCSAAARPATLDDVSWAAPARLAPAAGALDFFFCSALAPRRDGKE